MTCIIMQNLQNLLTRSSVSGLLTCVSLNINKCAIQGVYTLTCVCVCVHLFACYITSVHNNKLLFGIQRDANFVSGS